VADVAVVGAGIAGAAVAWELAAAGAEVVVLDAASQPGTHSTGRSAAVLTETTGPPVVRALARASRAFLASPPDAFSDVPLVAPKPVLWVADEAAAAAGRLGAVPEARPVTVEEARAMAPLLRSEAVAAAAVEDDGLEIDVDALLSGYLRGLRRRGGRVVCGARATALERVDRGWRLTTEAGGFGAAAVVDAAGAWADEVARLAGRPPAGLRPLRRTAFVFRPPPGVEVRGWPLVMDAAERFYLKPEGGLLLASPADETPTDPCDARAEEVDVAVGIDRIESAFDLRVRTVVRAWAGLRTFGPDRVPVVGPDPEQPSFVWLAGQGGYGIKTAPALARIAAEAVLRAAAPAR
jgi:D-arginine dehydrogenase